MAAQRRHSGTGHLPPTVGKVDIQGIQSVFKLSSIFSRQAERKAAEYTVNTVPRPPPDEKKRCKATGRKYDMAVKIVADRCLALARASS